MLRKLIITTISCWVLFTFVGADSVWAGRWLDNTNRWWELCNDWCDAREECSHCSTRRHCDGYDVLQSWTGYGNDTHACGREEEPDLMGARDAASLDNREACERWCDANEDCDKCSTLRHCGPGFRRLGRSWTGYGKNWHACEER